MNRNTIIVGLLLAFAAASLCKSSSHTPVKTAAIKNCDCTPTCECEKCDCDLKAATSIAASEPLRESHILEPLQLVPVSQVTVPTGPVAPGMRPADPPMVTQQAPKQAPATCAPGQACSMPQSGGYYYYTTSRGNRGGVLRGRFRGGCGRGGCGG